MQIQSHIASQQAYLLRYSQSESNLVIVEKIAKCIYTRYVSYCTQPLDATKRCRRDKMHEAASMQHGILATMDRALLEMPTILLCTDFSSGHPES